MDSTSKIENKLKRAKEELKDNIKEGDKFFPKKNWSVNLKPFDMDEEQ